MLHDGGEGERAVVEEERAFQSVFGFRGMPNGPNGSCRERR